MPFAPLELQAHALQLHEGLPRKGGIERHCSCVVSQTAMHIRSCACDCGHTAHSLLYTVVVAHAHGMTHSRGEAGERGRGASGGGSARTDERKRRRGRGRASDLVIDFK
jgi:hypothetical protein